MASKLVRIKQEDLDFIKTFEGKDVDNLSNIINFYKTFTETQNQSIMNGRPISRPEIKKGEEYTNWAYYETKLRPQARELDKPQSELFFASILKTLYTSVTLESVTYKGRVFENIPVATRQTIIDKCMSDLEQWRDVYPDFFDDFQEWTSHFQQTVDARIRTLMRRSAVAKDYSKEDHRISYYFWKGNPLGDKLNLDVVDAYLSIPANKHVVLPKMKERDWETEDYMLQRPNYKEVSKEENYKLWFGDKSSAEERANQETD